MIKNYNKVFMDIKKEGNNPGGETDQGGNMQRREGDDERGWKQGKKKGMK